jgi:hypothetical protein
MIPLVIAVIASIVLAVLIGAEIARQRKTTKAAAVKHRIVPRRQPQLEDRIRSAFDGPREKHGDIFVTYAIWRRDQEIRMELFAADPFAKLNEFTRCLIVRHLWRALEELVEGAVVVVDSPPQTWSKAVDEKFQDRGIDPWRIVPNLGSVGGPQFAKD